MFVAYSYFVYIIPVPVAIPNTSWLACEVCAEAAVMYDVFGERQSCVGSAIVLLTLRRVKALLC